MSLSKDLYRKYAKLVANNPETCADFELLSKYFVYLVSGKFSDNTILTEALFSFSHLLVVFNDQVIRRELFKDEIRNTNEEEHRLKLFLVILDSVEVFIEACSKKLLGNKRKFIVIFLIQAVKAIGRLILVLKYKNRISQTPAIEHLDRKNLFKERPNAPQQQHEQLNSTSLTFKLKRSGKTIRKVSNTRNNYPGEPELEENDRFGMLNHRAIKNAELIYIMKPLIHLGSVGLFGYKSWKSYFVSLFLDIFTIRQYYAHRNYMTSDQKKELSRRCVNMILYIFRSPFYDRYSSDKIDAFMRALNNLPFARFIVEPYRLYIPSYQDTYFYMFSN